jgi:hypothetical protein
MKTDMIETNEMRKGATDLVSGDQILDRIYHYLTNEPLNIGKDDYCYIRIVGNHLEIGRAKIVLNE